LTPLKSKKRWPDTPPSRWQAPLVNPMPIPVSCHAPMLNWSQVIIEELPKTAVGKVFKPALRRSAITRIYNAALAEKGLDARVVNVVEDKKRGLVAHLSGRSSTDDAAVTDTLGGFTRPWSWAENS